MSAPDRSNSDSNQDLFEFVESIGREVTTDDIDVIARLSEISSARSAEGQNRKLREIFGVSLLGLLAAQVISINILAFFLGFGLIEVDRLVAISFTSGVLAEITSLTVVVVRSLFPR